MKIKKMRHYTIKALWTAINQEKGYIEEGDRKGPDYGWGLAGNYTEQMLREIGMALEKLGEKPGDYPKPFHTWYLCYESGTPLAVHSLCSALLSVAIQILLIYPCFVLTTLIF